MQRSATKKQSGEIKDEHTKTRWTSLDDMLQPRDEQQPDERTYESTSSKDTKHLRNVDNNDKFKRRRYGSATYTSERQYEGFTKATTTINRLEEAQRLQAEGERLRQETQEQTQQAQAQALPAVPEAQQ
eukprot:2457766-Amphidinium_carterae.1